MKPLLREEISKIKKMLVENTEECFCVKLESDDAGNHYVLYLVKDSIRPNVVNKNMFNLKLSKHHMLIFLDEERVHIKRRENEK
tara:strand:+ start:288 stop:539 length:252 start_codon:yes stop_codon:yes gene_type:complete